MKEENKISVVINTYNAEKHLQRVIDAVRTFDEVLICDMESTDSTLDIARMNGCKIVTFPKGGTQERRTSSHICYSKCKLSLGVGC